MPRTIPPEAQPQTRNSARGKAEPFRTESGKAAEVSQIEGLQPWSQMMIEPMVERLPYTDAHIAAYPVEYIAGIDLYNAGEFHAAHDAWEDRWMGEVGQQEKLFLQAMIQSAVAFHHLEIGRPGAARQMHERAKEKFARLGTNVFMSLDLIDYQAQLDRALSWLWSVPDPRELTPPSFQVPTIRLLPEINEFD